ncbi:MAG: thioredoxin domain-containing protein [Myxococcota bacterium]
MKTSRLPASARSLASVAIRIALLALLVAGATLPGCSRLGIGAKDGADAASGARAGDDRVALVLEGDEITVGELNEHMKDQFLEEFLRQPEDRQYQMRESAIRELVQRHVVEREAKKRGLSPDALYDEITMAVPAVSVEDVSNWYKQNEARLGGARLEDVAPRIEQMLEHERRSQAWSAFLDPKLEALSWEMRLSPPRKDVEATRLARGPADAPVTLIAFSDYQCPYCIRSEQVLNDVMAKYPQDVRLVLRHFPLDQIHPFARPAAEAAMCADEQGRFWDFHSALFALDGDIDREAISNIAKQLDLDMDAFATCVAERRFEAYVEADAQAGEAAGVTGTPAFFVNGIPLTGARDVAEFSRVIDAELARIAQQAQSKPG